MSFRTNHAVVQTSIFLLFASIIAGCGSRGVVKHPADEVKQLIADKKLEQALARSNELLAKEPEDYELLISRGDAYVRLGRYTDAMADYSKLIQVYPKNAKAYGSRARLYRTMADAQGVDVEQKRIWEEASAADEQKRYLFARGAVEIQRNSSSRPLPEVTFFDPLAEPETTDEGEAPAPEQAELTDFVETRETSESADGPAKDAPDGRASAAEQLAMNKEGLIKPIDPVAKSTDEVIQERDLAQDSPDMTMPEHDQFETASVIPRKPVTRFDLQAFRPSPPGFVPPRFELPAPGAASTGIRSGDSAVGDNADDIVSSPGRTTGYGAGTFNRDRSQAGFNSGIGQFTPGYPQNLRSTGIRSFSRSAVTPGNPALFGSGVGIPKGFNGPTGFLPQSARGNFGPQLGQRGVPENADAPQRRTVPEKNAQILSTARPGTTIFYGAQNPQGATQVQYAPSLTDPNFSPLLGQPEGIQTLPNLPPR